MILYFVTDCHQCRNFLDFLIKTIIQNSKLKQIWGSFKNGLGGCFWPVVGGQGRVVDFGSRGEFDCGTSGRGVYGGSGGVGVSSRDCSGGSLVQVGGVGCWFMWGGEGVFQAWAIWISVPNKFYVCGEKYLTF